MSGTELDLLIPITSEHAARIDALYERIPKLNCQRKCQECCGPIFMSRLEWQRICSQLRRVPQGRADLNCPMLKNGTDCRVYAIRPAVCRLWGVVEAMRCPWGCEPDRWLAEEESREILAELESISIAK
jgi:Fe-S-cluster containining protein